MLPDGFQTKLTQNLISKSLTLRKLLLRFGPMQTKFQCLLRMILCWEKNDEESLVIESDQLTSHQAANRMLAILHDAGGPLHHVQLPHVDRHQPTGDEVCS